MADYSKGKNYPLEKSRKYDVVAGMSRGITRSPEQRAAETKAWDEAAAAKEHENKTGAGRGGQGGPTAKEADLNRAMMSPAERAARDEMQEQKEIRKNQEAYNKSLTNLKKGGYVKAADGIAKRGKTRGVMVACGGGYMKKGK